MELKINNLSVQVNKDILLKDINLEVERNQTVAIMGPNGSGKSSLAKTIMGIPKYKIQKGEILFENKNINDMTVEQRAKLGIFVSMQDVTEMHGINFKSYLKLAYNSIFNTKISPLDFNRKLNEIAKAFDIDEKLLDKNLNENLSGGEKKKMQLVELLVLKPKLAILDEIDAGLDIDSLKTIFSNLAKIENLTILVITHTTKIFNYLKADSIYIIKNGEIVKKDNPQILDEIEKNGYKNF